MPEDISHQLATIFTHGYTQYCQKLQVFVVPNDVSDSMRRSTYRLQVFVGFVKKHLISEAITFDM